MTTLTQDRPILDAARLAVEAGLCVVPARGKAPVGRWQHRQDPSNRSTFAEVEQWFAEDGHTAMGVICGRASGGLEMIETEGRTGGSGVGSQFVARVREAGLGHILDGYTEQSPSGGLHILYRCPDVGGNAKLAAEAGGAVLIETRGEGGFVVTAPSVDGDRDWRLLAGGFDTIATITAAQREQLFSIARSFNKRTERLNLPQRDRTAPVEQRDKNPELPLDDFNERAPMSLIFDDWDDWTHVKTIGEEQYWRRPGSMNEHSLTINFRGNRKLYVFSTSLSPLAGNTSYSRFDAWAAMRGYDLSDRQVMARAVEEVRAMGYGAPLPEPVDPADLIGGDRDIAPADVIAPVTLDEARRAPENTDLGNARRLVQRDGEDLRHVSEWGKWLTWGGRRWGVDKTGEVHRLAKATAESILDEARSTKDPKLFAWGIASESAARLEAMVRVATTEPGIPALVEQLDADPFLLSVENGTLSLRPDRFGLLPHQRGDLITKVADVKYDAAAACPRFDGFLEEILPDAQVRRFVQKAVGASLTGDVSEQVLFFAHGSGANGKSTLMELLLRILGEYAMMAAPRLLIAERHTEHPTQVADLFGRRLVVAQEIQQGQRLNEELVKQLTGSDTVKARYMRQDYFSFQPSHKLWLCANHKPIIRGTDHAIWRRIRLIPFEVTIPEDRRDKQLGRQLWRERSGVLRWAVEGCLAWHREGLEPPDAVINATQAYRDDMDMVGQFIAECCVVGPLHRVPSSDLYRAYVDWCTGNGLIHPLSRKALAGRLRERGFDQADASRKSWWHGLDLAEQLPESLVA
jgi:putative DNA primase/helicase